MKVSLKWLRRYLPELNASVDQISKALTAVGLEVEGIEDQGAPYSGLIVAKVLTRSKHPEADKLSVTTVFDGQNELQVVCGAPNVDAGQTVCFAPIGSSLPLPDGTLLKLKKAKLRGVESNGMICAEDEVGLGVGHDGIMVLPDHHAAGTPFVQLGHYDVVFELNVTPNRPDALSHIGVARELARVFGIALHLPKAELRTSTTPIAQLASLAVEDSACTRYIARVIEGVHVGPSPEWLQALLRSVGIRPISNVVDCTNFVLLEWGQPLHAFDLDKVGSHALKVRAAQDKEILVTLDGQTRTLAAGELVIADSEGPACLAGVMGGQRTEVDDSTQRILLETAYFHPATVRRQARRHGLHSDSSHRFERGIDPTATEALSAYAAALIADICGGRIAEGSLSHLAPQHPTGQTDVTLRFARVAAILGFAPAADEIVQALAGIGLELLERTEEYSRWRTPGFRPDLEREIDLIEEIARLVGYDKVPTIFPALAMRSNPLPEFEQTSRVIRRNLASQGLHEGLSLRFESKKALEQLFPEDDARRHAVALKNPLSEEWALLPSTFAGRMLKAASYNLRNQEKTVRLFELATVFSPAERHDLKKDTGAREQAVLSGIVAGEWSLTLSDKPAMVGFLDAKAILESLFQALRIRVEWQRPETNEPFLHPYRQATLMLGKNVLGWIGEVHPVCAEAFEIDAPAILFELNADLLVKKALPNVHFGAFSRFGAMQRDLSVLVPAQMDQALVINKLASLKAKNLKAVHLRSTYQGPGIDNDKKSLLVQFTYQAEDRTLTDEEVNNAHSKLRENIAKLEEITLR